MTEQRFNIRVYGIVINPQRELLVMDELIKGIEFTKFPGGGLEWGEGALECLHREFDEELHQPIEVMGHYYTTDYFQASAFREKDQLMSLYYMVQLRGAPRFDARTKPFDFPVGDALSKEVPRWLPLAELTPDDFKWPVDKKVVAMLLNDDGIWS